MRPLVLSLAVAASGCATLGGSLSGPRLPYEARVWLLDAEEDLMTAHARFEQAERDVSRAKGALDETEARLETLWKSPLEKEAKADVTVAKAQLTRATRSAELLEASMGCAERRYAAARARAQVKFKVEGADEREADALTDRAQSCEGRLEKKELALTDAEEALVRARAERDRASLQAAAQAPALHPRPWLE